MIVSTSVDCPFSWVNKVALAIRSFPGETSPGQRHVAFLYRLDDGSPKLVHLAWHHMLKRDDPEPEYMWADFAELVQEDRRVMAGFLSKIGTRGPLIPFGLAIEGIKFDLSTGELLDVPHGGGMTCATFVFVVLKVLGHEVVDLGGWPTDRREDVVWQTDIVDKLSKWAPQHAEAVKKNSSCVRLRPEEVVGASAAEGWSIDFSTAETLGVQVLAEMSLAGLLF
jgi:hypothetical protein